MLPLSRSLSYAPSYVLPIDGHPTKKGSHAYLYAVAISFLHSGDLCSPTTLVIARLLLVKGEVYTLDAYLA